MHKQGLLGSSQGEVLALRWANEDPNPTAVVATKRAHMDTFEKVRDALSFGSFRAERKAAAMLGAGALLHSGAGLWCCCCVAAAAAATVVTGARNGHCLL